MNLYYLQAVYELSLVRINSQRTSEEPHTPGRIEAVYKKSKFFQNDDRKPQSHEEVNELIQTFDQLAQLYREYLLKHAMSSATWKANQQYLISRNGMDQGRILNGDSTLCVPDQKNVYIVDRGTFYFYIVEEGGKMRVAGLGIE